MIHRMDPPADPTAEPMPAKVAPMLARLGGLPRDDDRWALRGQVGRRARDLPLRAGAAAALQPQPQRDHGPVPGARAAEPGAQPPPRDPRRRGRGLRRRGTAGLRGAPAAHAPDLRGARSAAWPKSAPVTLRPLRPAVARRPQPHRRALRGAPRAAAGARARRRALADAGPRRRPRRRAAGREPRAGARGDRRQAAGLDLRAGPALAELGQGQERAGVRRSSSAAGCPAKAAGATGSARCSPGSATTRTAGACATSAASGPASPRTSSTGSRRAWRRWSRTRRRSRPGRPRPAGAHWARPALVGRGRVPRLDPGAPAARTGLQGAARGQAAAARRARRARPRGRRRRRHGGAALEPRQGPVSGRRLHEARRRRLRRAGAPRSCCRTSRAAR